MSTFSKGEWKAYNMTNSETGEDMTPDDIAEYVKSSVLVNPDIKEFLFISVEKPDGAYDVCHVGNGPDRAANAHLISAAPDMYEALEQAVTSMQDSGYSNNHLAVKAARKALLKAQGGEA